MKTALLYILLSIPAIGFTQIDFTNEPWSEIVKRSRIEKKAIFVDVYTAWCAPCKKMDRTTFQDPILGAYMNKHFINVKWDAEGAKYGQLSSKYNVSAFPTILFLDFNGVVHKRKVGFQNSERLLALSREVSKFLTTDYTAVSRELLANPNVKDLEFFLADNIGMEFLSKEMLFDKYMELLYAGDQLAVFDATGEAYDILIDNMHTPENVGLAIEQLPQADPTSKNVDVQNHKKKMYYQSKIKANLMLAAKECIKTRKLDQLEKYLELNYLFGKKTNKITKGKLTQKENDNLRKEYYRKFRYYDFYILLVEKILERDILSTTPEELSKTDTRAQTIITERELTHGPVSGSNRRLILKNHSKTYKIAETLTEFSDDYIQFFSTDNQKLSEALEFTDLALEYIDLPETRLSRARIFKLLKQVDKALLEANLGLESPLMDWRVKSKLINLQKSLSR